MENTESNPAGKTTESEFEHFENWIRVLSLTEFRERFYLVSGSENNFVLQIWIGCGFGSGSGISTLTDSHFFDGS